MKGMVQCGDRYVWGEQAATRGFSTHAQQAPQLGRRRPAAVTQVPQPAMPLLEACDLEGSPPTAGAHAASTAAVPGQGGAQGSSGSAGTGLRLTDNRYNHKPAFQGLRGPPASAGAADKRAASPAVLQRPAAEGRAAHGRAGRYSGTPPKTQQVREGQGITSRRGEAACVAGRSSPAGTLAAECLQPRQAKRRKQELMGAGDLLSIAGSRKGGSAAAPSMHTGADAPTANPPAAVDTVPQLAKHQAWNVCTVGQAGAADSLRPASQDVFVLIESDIFA